MVGFNPINNNMDNLRLMQQMRVGGGQQQRPQLGQQNLGSMSMNGSIMGQHGLRLNNPMQPNMTNMRSAGGLGGQSFGNNIAQLNDILSSPMSIQNPNAQNPNVQGDNNRPGLMQRLFNMRHGNGPEQAQGQERNPQELFNIRHGRENVNAQQPQGQGQDMAVQGRKPQNPEQMQKYVADGARQAGISEQDFARQQGIAPRQPRRPDNAS